MEYKYVLRHPDNIEDLVKNSIFYFTKDDSILYTDRMVEYCTLKTKIAIQDEYTRPISYELYCKTIDGYTFYANKNWLCCPVKNTKLAKKMYPKAKQSEDGEWLYV